MTRCEVSSDALSDLTTSACICVRLHPFGGLLLEHSPPALCNQAQSAVQAMLSMLVNGAKPIGAAMLLTFFYIYVFASMAVCIHVHLSI